MIHTAENELDLDPALDTSEIDLLNLCSGVLYTGSLLGLSYFFGVCALFLTVT